MLTKLKLALAFATLLGAGATGLAVANTGAPADSAEQTVAQPTGGGWKQKMLEKYDLNKDGKLDDAERAKMRADRQAERAERRKEMLEKYDTNKDGKLEPNERKAMIDDRADKRFEKLDTNHDGSISKEEFRAGMEKMAMRGHNRFRRHHGRGNGQGGQRGGNTAPTGGTAPSQ
jgi:Spy/CpxP family protein refolding chaperone